MDAIIRDDSCCAFHNSAGAGFLLLSARFLVKGSWRVLERV